MFLLVTQTYKMLPFLNRNINSILSQYSYITKQCFSTSNGRVSSQTTEIAQKLKSIKIGFIGAGNMAKAIIEGIVQKKLVTYSQIYISEPREAGVQKWKQKNVNAFQENGKILEEADIIFLAVKPHILPIAIAGTHKTLKNPDKAANKLFVSIIAGITTDSLEVILKGFKGSRVVRVFPNTPMMVGEGCSIYCGGKSTTDTDMAIVHAILESIGTCDLIPEHMFNAAGAVSGSGPAYVFLVIEALSDAAVKMGVPRQYATGLAAQTVLGSAKLVLRTKAHPGSLKDDVCSPGGTSIAGIHELEKGGVRGSFMNAVEAATRKAATLGKKHG